MCKKSVNGYWSPLSVTMNKATFAPSAAAATIIMNHKPTAATSTATKTSQIAVVHLSSSNASKSSSAAATNAANVGISFSASKSVNNNRNGPSVPPKPSMISYRNGLSNSDPIVKSGTSIKVNLPKQSSDQSEKSLTDNSTGSPVPPDARAKQVLKEAVNAVVNSFAKHSQGGYGRGELAVSFMVLEIPSSPFIPCHLPQLQKPLPRDNYLPY